MEVLRSLADSALLTSPLLFSALVGLAALLVWLAFSPVPPVRQVKDRLDGYLERPEGTDEAAMSRPFASRVLGPALRGLLRTVGRLAPGGYAGRTEQALVQAGRPGGLTPLDFVGLRLLCAVLPALFFYLVLSPRLPASFLLRSPFFNSLLVAVLGFFAPYFWLGSRVRRRKHQIQRALPDALDMLTIGVEAGLAFESAMLRVGEQWDNPLTREFRRAVAEMRVGTARDEALARMAGRTGVPDLATFVAILIQSGQLGVSIAHVLHTQAAEMRVKRQQRAEELARQAGVKMLIPLVLLVFPALMVVILGPALPRMVEVLGGGIVP